MKKSTLLLLVPGVTLVVLAIGVVFMGLGPVIGNCPAGLAWSGGVFGFLLVVAAGSAHTREVKHPRPKKSNNPPTRPDPPVVPQKKAGNAFPPRSGQRRNR